MVIEYTLRQLEVFAAAAEQESLTRAAELLHLTQSTASTHLRSLEQCLGVPLLLRRGQGGVSLTEEGQKLYPMVKKILSQCQALTAAAGDPLRQACPPLLLGASTVPGQYMLPELMASFFLRHPECRYELRHGDSAQVHKLLQSGQVRLGFVGSRIEGDAMDYCPLVRDELVMVTPNIGRYQALQRRGAWGQELLGEPTIAREQGSGTDRTLQQYMARTGYDTRKLHIVARLDDPETIKRMVAQGAGVSVLSALSVRQEVKDGRVLTFPMDENGLKRTIYLAHRQNLSLTAVERQFLSFVQGHYKFDKA